MDCHKVTVVPFSDSLYTFYIADKTFVLALKNKRIYNVRWLFLFIYNHSYSTGHTSQVELFKNKKYIHWPYLTLCGEYLLILNIQIKCRMLEEKGGYTVLYLNGVKLLNRINLLDFCVNLAESMITIHWKISPKIKKRTAEILYEAYPGRTER